MRLPSIGRGRPLSLVAALALLAATTVVSACDKRPASGATEGSAAAPQDLGAVSRPPPEAGNLAPEDAPPPRGPPSQPARFLVLKTVGPDAGGNETLRVGSDGTIERTAGGRTTRAAVPAADIAKLFGWLDGPAWRELAEKRPPDQPGPTTFVIEATGRRIERTQPVPYDDLFHSVLQELLDWKEVAALVERADGTRPVCRFRQTGGIAAMLRDVIVWADGVAETGEPIPADEPAKRATIDAAAVSALDQLLSSPEWRALPADGGPVAMDAYVYTIVTPAKRVRWSEPIPAGPYTTALEMLHPILTALGLLN